MPKPKKPRRDLLCEHCQKAESTHLIYYRQYHPESGRYSKRDPKFVCDHCADLFRDSNLLFQHMPVIVPFSVIAKWSDKQTGAFLSRKGYEFNVFSNKYWRKKIWRARIIWQCPKKDPI
jgi:hypothetical protein